MAFLEASDYLLSIVKDTIYKSRDDTYLRYDTQKLFDRFNHAVRVYINHYGNMISQVDILRANYHQLCRGASVADIKHNDCLPKYNERLGFINCVHELKIDRFFGKQLDSRSLYAKNLLRNNIKFVDLPKGNNSHNDATGIYPIDHITINHLALYVYDDLSHIITKARCGKLKDC